MFTLEQINDIHDRLGNADTLAEYLKALHAIGVVTAESFITDGHSEYFGSDGHKVVSGPAHPAFAIADTPDKERFLEYMRLSEQAKIGYEEMSKGFADSGVEKWTFDTAKLTISYYDKAGQTLLSESLAN